MTREHPQAETPSSQMKQFWSISELVPEKKTCAYKVHVGLDHSLV